MTMIKQRGIALIQVLLITAILTVFALYLTQSARQQAKIAFLAKNRALAEVINHSSHSEIVFELLTNQHSMLSNAGTSNTVVNKWNFYGKPFALNKYASIFMQDQAGLLNLQYLFAGMFTQFLTTNGVELSRADQIVDRLLDWQDADIMPRANGVESPKNPGMIRNGKIADIKEIEHIIELSPFEKELIYKNSTIFYVGDLNPMTSPFELLSSLSSKSAAQQIDKMRDNNELTISSFQDITGIGYSDAIRFYPSNTLAIKYKATINNVSLVRELVISLSPYAKRGKPPYNIMLNRS
jgi:general secretion pathway protein K